MNFFRKAAGRPGLTVLTGEAWFFAGTGRFLQKPSCFLENTNRFFKLPWEYSPGNAQGGAEQ
jgi:hypothetical protein